MQGLSQKRSVRAFVFDYGNAGNREYPSFLKQWGGVRKAKNGRLLDGRTYDEYPERVSRPIPERAECVAWAQEFGNSFQARGLS